VGLHDVVEALIHKISWHSEAEKAEVLTQLEESKAGDPIAAPPPAEPEPAPETPTVMEDPPAPMPPASTL
jgi:hypothetical protein